MAGKVVSPPAYAASKFVDRESEVALVMDKARAIAQGCPVEGRVIVFAGGRGLGKSWLLSYIRDQLASVKDLSVYALSLKGHTSTPVPALIVNDILAKFARSIFPGKHWTSPADLSQELRGELRALLQVKVLAVLVDEVHEADPRLLEELERYFLGPLALEPRVLIVMTGRGRLPLWRTPGLRLKALVRELQPFADVDCTREQLTRQQPNAASRALEIHSLSNGNPLANYLLAAHPDPIAALDQVIEGMLEPLPAAERQQAREYLEALCVLRSFDEERIQAALLAYDSKYRGWTFEQARQVREYLVRWAFARWDGPRGGYITDEPTRRLVEVYLMTAQRTKWLKLHESAIQLYTDWASKYPGAAAHWQGEIDYHNKCLANASQ